MSKRAAELFLFDILIAVLKIEETVKRFDDASALKYDYLAWDSIVREFEIIGEATNKLIKEELLGKEQQIVVDLRNLLIHHYFGIDEDAIWSVVQNDLGAYKKVIIDKIETIDHALKDELIENFRSENSHLMFITDALDRLK